MIVPIWNVIVGSILLFVLITFAVIGLWWNITYVGHTGTTGFTGMSGCTGTGYTGAVVLMLPEEEARYYTDRFPINETWRKSTNNSPSNNEPR